MNINKIRQTLRIIPAVNDIGQGPEFLFTQKVKGILPSTNFELLGEQLIVGKDNGIGKCDLWLANIPNNFLLSLELKVGEASDLSKRKFLKTQVYKYTGLMRHYFPDNIVYGVGAYKCVNKCVNKCSIGTCMKFVDYVSYEVTKIPINHSEEIEKLKQTMKKDCLN
jgi:hypothetical protein